MFVMHTLSQDMRTSSQELHTSLQELHTVYITRSIHHCVIIACRVSLDNTQITLRSYSKAFELLSDPPRHPVSNLITLDHTRLRSITFDQTRLQPLKLIPTRSHQNICKGSHFFTRDHMGSHAITLITLMTCNHINLHSIAPDQTHRITLDHT